MAALTGNLGLIGARGWFAGGVVSASSEDPQNPAANLTPMNQTSEWRSNPGDTGGIDVVVDLGTTRSICAVILGATNLTAAATVEEWYSAVSDFATNVYHASSHAAFDNTLAGRYPFVPRAGRNLVTLRNAGPVACRYARLRITDSSNPANYLSACWGYAEDVWQAGHNIAQQWSEPDRYVGEETTKGILRGGSYILSRLTEAEMYDHRALARSWRDQGRVYVLRSPLKPATWISSGFWAHFPDPPQVDSVDKLGRFYSMALKVEEADF